MDAWPSLLGGSRDSASALARAPPCRPLLFSPALLPSSSSASLSLAVLGSRSLCRLLQLPGCPLLPALAPPAAASPLFCLWLGHHGVRRRLFGWLRHPRLPLLICTVARFFSSAHCSVWLTPDCLCVFQSLHPLRSFYIPCDLLSFSVRVGASFLFDEIPATKLLLSLPSDSAAFV